MAVPRPGPRTTAVVPLVVAARTGDRRALEQLVRLTAADTWGLAHRLVGTEDVASDVVEEVYLRAVREIARLPADAPIATRLHRLTAGAAARRLGRRNDRFSDGEQVVDLAVAAAGPRERLAAELAGLPPRLRAVVVLHDLYDLPSPAIAAELGISLRAAEARLHRGRTRLRQRLFPFPGGRGRGRSGRCEGLTRALSAAAGDAPDARACRHASACLRCQAELAQLRRLRRALRDIRGDVRPPPPHLVADVLAAVAGAAHQPPPRPSIGRRPLRAGSLAVATAAAGAALVRRQRGRRTTG